MVWARAIRFSGAAILLLGTMTLNNPAIAASAGGDRAQAQYTDTGVEGCLTCHAGENMTVMADTVHGGRENPHTPYANRGCEECHGPGSLHVSRARGGAGFPALIRYGSDGDAVEVQLDSCLGCHESDLGEHAAMQWRGSLHDFGGMTCSTCHEMHTTANPLSQRDGQIASCEGCHRGQIDDHDRFESAGILFDELTCSTCHNPHQLTRRN